MARGLDFILSRNAFYTRTYRRMLLVSIILTFLMALLVGLNILVAKTHPRSKYFPTSPDGKLTKDPARTINHLNFDLLTIFPDGSIEDAPKWLNVKDERDRKNGLVRMWVERAISSLFSYDYKSYRLSLTNLRDLFTKRAYEEFKIGLYESRNIETVISEKSVVHLNILEPAQLVSSGIMKSTKGDIRVWNYLIPIEVVYESVEQKHSLFLVAKMLVIRESILVQHFFGLKIAKLNFKTMPAPEQINNKDEE
ncbi:MAG: DotI/IcmL/TraM family protein [Francisellaceae bacterium]|jgi:hypothetical protein|nr:DotI/IcmL/TraM family protein [Francisellaceae bacterium]MBT6208270.1 DotI/IcmL/TraM family protein [Francisellaceae bacterium]MBT6538266.1 DotI/IcmL/TraM family protein [Francisellaceae bacterium]